MDISIKDTGKQVAITLSYDEYEALERGLGFALNRVDSLDADAKKALGDLYWSL